MAMIDLGQQQSNGYNVPVPRVQMPQVPQMPFMAQPEKVAPLGEMIFVDTKEQLQGVNIPANSQRVFFSKTMQGFYVVETDKMGIQKISTYRFEEIKEPAPDEKYVTRAEFQELLNALGGKHEPAISKANE
jgi:hypothetical protein